jgi:hypothetical protein
LEEVDYKSKSLKFIQEWKWAMVLLSICIIGIPLTTIYGVRSVAWGNGFWPNAFSEFLGMFVDLIFGAIFTLVVIDKYIQYHKNSQWKKIKENTYKNLYFILSNILLKLNWAFPKEVRIGSYVLTEDMGTLNDYLPKDEFDGFVTSLVQSIDILIEGRHSRQSYTEEKPDSFADEQLHLALEKFKQHTKSDINSISSLVIPKLLNFSDDPVLLDDVIELEELFTSLMSKIKNVHRKNSNGDYDVKYIWLLKIQEMLNRIAAISKSIQKDLTID